MYVYFFHQQCRSLLSSAGSVMLSERNLKEIVIYAYEYNTYSTEYQILVVRTSQGFVRQISQLDYLLFLAPGFTTLSVVRLSVFEINFFLYNSVFLFLNTSSSGIIIVQLVSQSSYIRQSAFQGLGMRNCQARSF